MAKELKLGNRNNVEDIAASFKRMAIINPERKRLQQPMPPVAELPEPPEAKPMETKPKTQYDEIIEETKKKSKKVVVDENQLSLFDFAA